MNTETLEIDFLLEIKFWKLSNVCELKHPLTIEIPEEGLLILKTPDGRHFAVLTPELLVLVNTSEIGKLKNNLFKVQKEIYLKKQRDSLAAERLDLYKRQAEFDAKIQDYVSEIENLKSEVKKIIDESRKK